MSLITWVPLVGTTIEDKCMKRSLTASGLTSNLAGKLGVGYNSFNGSSSYLSIPNVQLSPTMSFSIWVNMTTAKNCFLVDARNSSGVGYQPMYYNTSLGIQCASSTGSQYIATGALQANKWYHIVMVINNGIATLYLDGVKKGSTTSNAIPVETNNTTVTIGSRYSLDTATKLSGLLQDIRIYDHCLSLAEIKELSKGLILHYSFDSNGMFGNTVNLVNFPTPVGNANNAWNVSLHPNALNVADWTNGYNGGVSNPATGYHAMWNLIDNIPTIVFNNLNSQYGYKKRWLGISGGGLDTEKRQSLIGKTISISYEAKGKSGMQIGCGLYHYDTAVTDTTKAGFYSQTTEYQEINDQWKRYFVNVPVRSTLDASKSASVYIYGHCDVEGTSYVRNIQLEINDYATAYTSSSRTNIKVINDLGIGFDGTPNDITYIDHSASGLLSCKFNGSTSGISVPYIKSDLVSSDYTLAFWIYPTTTNRDTIFGDYQTTGAVGVNIERRATTGNLRIYYGADIFTESSSIQGISMPQNTWTHIAVTYNSSSNVFTIYKNGIKAPVSYTKDVSSFTKSNGIFWIGRDNRATSPEAFEGNLSDFRFYSTCLSQTDIKDLYNTKASISKLGDVLSSEFLEAQSEFSVSKKYIVNTEDIEEIDIPSSYQRLSYIQSNGTQYIDTEFYSTPKSKFCAEILFDNTAGVSDYSSAAFIGVSGDMSINFGGSSGQEKQLFIWLNTYNNDSSRVTSIRHSAINEKTYYELDAKNNTYIIGNQKGTVATSKTTNGTYSLKLFGSTNSSGVNKPFAYYPMRIYNCKLYDDNKLVRHFIPTKRISDNALGLYDIVTNTFYTNKGTGSFTTSAQGSNFQVQIYKNNTLQCRYINEV